MLTSLFSLTSDTLREVTTSVLQKKLQALIGLPAYVLFQYEHQHHAWMLN